jgi:hypothetical protein
MKNVVTNLLRNCWTSQAMSGIICTEDLDRALEGFLWVNISVSIINIINSSKNNNNKQSTIPGTAKQPTNEPYQQRRGVSTAASGRIICRMPATRHIAHLMAVKESGGLELGPQGITFL